MKKIVFYIGPSSSGKDAILKKTLLFYDIIPILLLTTRPPRPTEVNGNEYYFIDEEKMNTMDFNHELIERRDYKTIHGIWSYATNKTSIDLAKYNYITSNTWVGYQKFFNFYSKECLIPIYFEVNKGLRLQRALDRENKSKNSDYSEMCRRFLADEQDFTKEMIATYKPIIVDNNGTLEETMEQIDDIMIRKLEILPKK